MADILLIEPDYKNKYPPLGLMKIAYFHKYVHKDFVRFTKGPLSEAFKDKKWDRVYVATLFTFEWKNTEKALKYACSVVKDQSQVYVGGILATLMPDLIRENFPHIIIIEGLLNREGTLGLAGEECVDTITPDYNILDDIEHEYVYPAQDAYFLYMTRGCGMKCQFCAVQTLEPKYIPYFSITDIVKRINDRYGSKRNLLLMDNNVLRSPDFDKIIDEIKELGFSKGATYVNPKTGRQVQRFIDFNQGLDAFLLNSHKAKRLGELALRPGRIAFDHIEDRDAYEKAIRLCAENGITHVSNYLLYNGEDFNGKGQFYNADTPEDLYNRMKISMDLCDKLNEILPYKIRIFSFPMRYIPLSDTKRGFVGDRWNAKYLRALQRMLVPTQGKGVASRSFFEADFGKSETEFAMFLAMPDDILAIRGHFVTKKNEQKKETIARNKVWEENQAVVAEWKRLFYSLGSFKESFISKIADNNYSVEGIENIENELQKKLFIHYFTMPGLLKLFITGKSETKTFVLQYMTLEFPILYKRLINHIGQSRLPHSWLEGLYKMLDQRFVSDIINIVDICSPDGEYIVNSLLKVQSNTSIKIFDFELIKYFQLYYKAKAISQKTTKQALSAIKALNEKQLRDILIANFPKLKTSLLNVTAGQVAGEYLLNEIEKNLKQLYEQLSLF